MIVMDIFRWILKLSGFLTPYERHFVNAIRAKCFIRWQLEGVLSNPPMPSDLFFGSPVAYISVCCSIALTQQKEPTSIESKGPIPGVDDSYAKESAT